MLKLELKESNSPFWLLGLSNGKVTMGSATNVPCYFKAGKKQYELASKIIKESGIDEVYLITGVVWDNMKGSWSVKEAGSYVQNKGKLVLSKNEITSYEEKYAESLKEDKYPKGVSREPLPKDGAKVYTSPATALEGKGDENKMKLELNDDKIIKEDIDNIPETLQDRFFQVMADGRPSEFKKFTKEELVQFAEFVKELPEQEVTELERSKLLYAISMAHGDDLTVESLKESYTKNEFIKKHVYCTSKYDIYCLKNNKDNFFVMKKGETPWENKELIQTDIDGVKHIDKLKLKESKIVTPVGNPQTAGSFVNIDVDLDHMEVSDFIVRLAQAIRSEQTAVLEYVALTSANGITNEDRTVIEGIMKEEKNHMCALTALLYKQILMNHKENVDEANDEFILPKFGADLFDENNKLTESVDATLNKIMAIAKESTMTVDDLINELKTDTNYDEIVYHIHEYSKTDKNKAMELMDLLFELEDNKSPKECRDEIIKSLQVTEASVRMSDEYFIGNTEDGRMYYGLDTAMNVIRNMISTSGEQVIVQNVTLNDTMTEDVKISFAGETMSQTQYDIEVDVDYDADFQGKVATNIINAIHSMNPTTYANDKYAIAEDEGKTKLGDTLSFELLIYNDFDKEVNEEFIESIVKRLLDKASTYEYYVTLK